MTWIACLVLVGRFTSVADVKRQESKDRKREKREEKKKTNKQKENQKTQTPIRLGLPGWQDDKLSHGWTNSLNIFALQA